MKVGMNLLLWTVHPTVKEHRTLFENLRDWGYDGIEFPIADVSRTEAGDLKKLVDDLGMECTTVLGLDVSKADPASGDAKLRNAALEAIKRAVDITVTLGSDLLAGPIFQGLGQLSGRPPTADEWRRSVDVIRASAEYAADNNVRLALEPLNRFEMSLVNTVADGARFCLDTGIPNVGLLVDTHHSNIEECDTASAWRAVADRIFYVHISENDRGVPGRGHAVGADVFRVLHEIGYDGWLTIEAFGRQVESLIPRFHVWRDYFDEPKEVPIEGLKFVRTLWDQTAANGA